MGINILVLRYEVLVKLLPDNNIIFFNYNNFLLIFQRIIY